MNGEGPYEFPGPRARHACCAAGSAIQPVATATGVASPGGGAAADPVVGGGRAGSLVRAHAASTIHASQRCMRSSVRGQNRPNTPIPRPPWAIATGRTFTPVSAVRTTRV